MAKRSKTKPDPKRSEAARKARKKRKKAQRAAQA